LTRSATINEKVYGVYVTV